jgi:hypothetical protein
MRTFICHLLMFSVLFMSAEGAFDMAKESHAHRDNTAHQMEGDGHTPVNPDPPSDESDNQCGHICHGHTSSIISDSNMLVMVASSRYTSFALSSLPTLLQAPPTPPPNA